MTGLFYWNVYRTIVDTKSYKKRYSNKREKFSDRNNGSTTNLMELVLNWPEVGRRKSEVGTNPNLHTMN